MASSIDPNAPRVFNKTRGFPSDAVYIGRGSPWGNPFVIGKDGSRDHVCDLFAEKVLSDTEFTARVKRELKGKHLVCFCKPLRCHGDFLLLLANQPDPTPDPQPTETDMTAKPTRLTKEEWMQRYADRLVAISDIDASTAMEVAETGTEDLDPNDDADWNDPEGAADEELSNWGD